MDADVDDVDRAGPSDDVATVAPDASSTLSVPKGRTPPAPAGTRSTVTESPVAVSVALLVAVAPPFTTTPLTREGASLPSLTDT